MDSMRLQMASTEWLVIVKALKQYKPTKDERAVHEAAEERVVNALLRHIGSGRELYDVLEERLKRAEPRGRAS